MLKFYSLEETDLSDFIEDVTTMGQPVYAYQYDDDGDTYILVSDNEIDDDDLENVFNEKIEQLEDDDEN